MVKNFTTRASEQKDASLESPLRVSEQKDASLEHFFEAPEPKSLSLESPTTVSLHQRPLKWFPTAAPSGHWPQKCFPTVALSGQRPPRCFPMAANEWRSPLSAGRVGAYCIRPRCSEQETVACGWKVPLYVIAPAGALGGAYAIRPYPDGRQRADTPKMFSDDSAFGSFAPKMVSNDSAFGSAAPMIFFRENCNKRRASASQ